MKNRSLVVLGKGKHRRVVNRADAKHIVKESNHPERLAMNPQHKRIAALKSLALAS